LVDLRRRLKAVEIAHVQEILGKGPAVFHPLQTQTRKARRTVDIGRNRAKDVRPHRLAIVVHWQSEILIPYLAGLAAFSGSAFASFNNFIPRGKD
jgi:hypothetical protein